MKKFIFLLSLLLFFVPALTGQESADVISKEYFRQGLELFQKKDWNSAAQLFEKAVQKNPQFAQAYEVWGRTELYAGHLDRALALSQKALELDPRLAEAYANLTAIYQKQGVWLKGLDAGKKAIELNPNLARAHYHLGLLYFEQGLPEEAVKEYAKVVELAPNFPHIHIELGKAYGAADYADLEMEEYQKAVKESPDKAAAHRHLGFSYYKKKDHEAALRECLESLKAEPTNAETYFCLGNIHRDKDQPLKAMAAYQKAVSLNRDYLEAHRSLAPLALQQKRGKIAARSYEKILNNSLDIKIYPNLAYAYQLAGKTDQAIETWKKVLVQETSPDDIDVVHFNMGVLYRDKKNWDLAIESYKNAIALKPEQTDYHVALSVAYCEKKLSKFAFDEYQQSLNLKSSKTAELFKYLQSTCPPIRKLKAA